MRDRGTRPSAARGLMVCAGAVSATGVLAVTVAPDLAATARTLGAGHGGQLRFDTLLTWGCELVALVVAGWLTVLTVLLVIDARRGRASSRLGCPEWLRRVTWAACGVGVAAAITSPAQAVTQADADALGALKAPALLGGLAYPDRPVDAEGISQATQRNPSPMVTTAGARQHVVQRGDTLWAIAASTLSPQTGVADVDDRWRRIFADNASILGPDPDLIHPGTVLTVPTNTEEPR